MTPPFELTTVAFLRYEEDYYPQLDLTNVICPLGVLFALMVESLKTLEGTLKEAGTLLIFSQNLKI